MKVLADHKRLMVAVFFTITIFLCQILTIEHDVTFGEVFGETEVKTSFNLFSKFIIKRIVLYKLESIGAY